MYRLMIALAAAALVGTASADAQTSTYKVFDLGPVSDTPNALLQTMGFWDNHVVTLAYRINSTGQVAAVGGAQ